MYRRHILSWKKLCNRNISHSHTVGELFLTWEPSSVVCLYRSMASSFPMISAMVAFKIKYHKSITKLRNRTTKVTESLHYSELLHKISLRTQPTFDFGKKGRSHGWEGNRRFLVQYNYINMWTVTLDVSIQRRHWQPLSVHLWAYCTHPTHDVTDVMCGFPAKWNLGRNDCRNSILMTRHYPDLGSAPDWLKQIFPAQRLI